MFLYNNCLKFFADKVERHETSTRELESKQEIRNEWRNIRRQENIEIDTEVFSSSENRHTVNWNLEYTQDSERKLFNRLYLIKLNDEGRCNEFWQYCQIN